MSSAWYWVYHLLILTVLAAFAIYDVYHKRVPNKALVCFIPAALPAPFIRTVYDRMVASAPMFILQAVLGAAVGFTILLAAAMVSKDGGGVGGGDIKLAAMLGFIYGPYDIIAILLVASLLAMPVGLCRKRKSGGKTLRLAFAPFMAIGCLATVTMKILV